MISSTSDTLKDFRTESVWEHTYKYIVDVANLNDIDIQLPKHRQRKRPRRLDDSIITESTGSRELEATSSASERLKCSVYFPVLDHMLAEVDRRFSKENLEQLKSLHACHPSTSSEFLDSSLLAPMATFYGINTALLNSECILAKRTLEDTRENLESVMDVFKALVPLKSAFPTLVKLLQIVLTLVVSTATCERSFSALKRIKTYLRTTMSEQRLTDIALLSMETDLASDLAFHDVLKEFEGTDKNRTIILS